VIYNYVIFKQLNITWEGMASPNRTGALRVKSTVAENDNLLVESVTGRSLLTNHTIKIWDRDFAWRVSMVVGVLRECAERCRHVETLTPSLRCRADGIADATSLSWLGPFRKIAPR
jgi:hypothetical protein